MKRALLLLDLQVDFLARDGRLPIAVEQVDPLLLAVRTAVNHASRKHEPVINIGNEFRSTDFVSNVLRRFATMQRSVGSRWDPRASKGASGYFSKASGDAFSNPDLDPHLRSLGVATIVLCGVYASECVLKTARGALIRGYKVQILAPAVGDSSARARTRAIGKLRGMGAQVITDY
ncbi:nicotinamidase-related amidase [Granulicella aggregans]|uniref:Nicotinamidase-related amidase n=1 Tax=Granulicella aggregans TaxID=474949 RepID=A0A7W7ZKN3_9BACT|nr:cysteine hydrolase [Granulicella aggregans]MBB5061613.1 nicotinamidase-related amidase [Granulicella aggregans]